MLYSMINVVELVLGVNLSGVMFAVWLIVWRQIKYQRTMQRGSDNFSWLDRRDAPVVGRIRRTYDGSDLIIIFQCES